jgi:hypothetical protein
MDDRVWSAYGAERSQPVATGRKWDGSRNGSNKRKPLPWVATGCRSWRMVSRGSTVRVRQRALRDPARSLVPSSSSSLADPSTSVNTRVTVPDGCASLIERDCPPTGVTAARPSAAGRPRDSDFLPERRSPTHTGPRAGNSQDGRLLGRVGGCSGAIAIRPIACTEADWTSADNPVPWLSRS